MMILSPLLVCWSLLVCWYSWYNDWLFPPFFHSIFLVITCHFYNLPEKGFPTLLTCNFLITLTRNFSSISGICLKLSSRELWSYEISGCPTFVFIESGWPDCILGISHLMWWVRDSVLDKSSIFGFFFSIIAWDHIQPANSNKYRSTFLDFDDYLISTALIIISMWLGRWQSV